jgi:hypothetical protein
VRERTKYGIGAALGGWVGAPIIWLAAPFILRAFGVEHKPDPLLVIVITVVSGGLTAFSLNLLRTDGQL